jgi:uncharacterized protein
MFQKISTTLSISENQVRKTIALLDEGATIPFISRYRKEATGSLDEVQVAAIRDLRDQYVELEKRREAILKSLKELEKLTPELEKAVRGAETLAKLEDIYLPYKPKRKTRAMAAREKGLQELANQLRLQRLADPEVLAAEYLDDIEEALAGARDILAEEMMETAEAREEARNLFTRKTTVKSSVAKGKQEAGIKYKDYFDC